MEREQRTLQPDGLVLAGIGKALPHTCVTNAEIARHTDTSDEWIRSRSGIETRYFCRGERLRDLLTAASGSALTDAGISPDEIGLCIVATATSDQVTPSMAALLQRDLGLAEEIPAFDLNAACTGFLYGLQIAHSMLLTCVSEKRPYALLVGGERLSGIIDPAERGTYVLFGDGAAAAVLKLSERAEFCCRLGVRGDDRVLYCPRAGEPEPYLHMDGRAVFRFAVETILDGIAYLERTSGVSAADADYIVCHQANRRIIGHVQRQTGLPPERFYMNLQRYGNTSAASIPLALADMREEGLLVPGVRLFLIGFGAGLTWGAACILM